MIQEILRRKGPAAGLAFIEYQKACSACRPALLQSRAIAQAHYDRIEARTLLTGRSRLDVEEDADMLESEQNVRQARTDCADANERVWLELLQRLWNEADPPTDPKARPT